MYYVFHSDLMVPEEHSLFSLAMNFSFHSGCTVDWTRSCFGALQYLQVHAQLVQAHPGDSYHLSGILIYCVLVYYPHHTNEDYKMI